MKLVETPAQFEDWCAAYQCSKDELAKLLGVTRQTLYNWTHPKSPPLSKTIRSDEIRTDLENSHSAYLRIPRMLSLSLFALEQPNFSPLLEGAKQRKQAGKRC
jgi:hypothetical protein